MNKVTVYFVTQQWFVNADGVIKHKITLKPQTPKSAYWSGEPDTQRICVSNSLIGALSSVCKSIFLSCKTFIYKAEVDVDKLYQPTNEVPDCYLTGELWVLEDLELELFKVIRPTSNRIKALSDDVDLGLIDFEEIEFK